MSFLDRAKRKLASIGDGSGRIHIGDPRFDDWDVVEQFSDLQTGLAWRDVLREHGIEAELTSDWELDRYNRGDINLQVPSGKWSEAEELVTGLDL